MYQDSQPTNYCISHHCLCLLLLQDFCKDCRIVSGPVASSVFIRNCEDCVIVIACQQLRLRDCKNLSECFRVLYCICSIIIVRITTSLSILHFDSFQQPFFCTPPRDPSSSPRATSPLVVSTMLTLDWKLTSLVPKCLYGRMNGVNVTLLLNNIC